MWYPMWVPVSDHLPHSCPTMNLLQLAGNLERNKMEVGFRGPTTFIEILQSSLSSLISLPLKHRLDFSFVFSAPLLAWRNLFSASGIMIYYGIVIWEWNYSDCSFVTIMMIFNTLVFVFSPKKCFIVLKII